jgi:hypothetical protein
MTIAQQRNQQALHQALLPDDQFIRSLAQAHERGMRLFGSGPGISHLGRAGLEFSLSHIYFIAGHLTGTRKYTERTAFIDTILSPGFPSDVSVIGHEQQHQQGTPMSVSRD